MITEHDSIFVIKYISNKINNSPEKEVVLQIAREAKKRQAQLPLGGRKQKADALSQPSTRKEDIKRKIP